MKIWRVWSSEVLKKRLKKKRLIRDSKMLIRDSKMLIRELKMLMIDLER